MKRLSTILAAGTMALAISTPVLAGPVGMQASYAQPDSDTIAELQQASKVAQREARDGNKDNAAFTLKSYQIDQLVERMQSGQQVSQNRVDKALQPVVVW
jgi:hypothetical protein